MKIDEDGLTAHQRWEAKNPGHHKKIGEDGLTKSQRCRAKIREGGLTRDQQRSTITGADGLTENQRRAKKIGADGLTDSQRRSTKIGADGLTSRQRTRGKIGADGLNVARRCALKRTYGLAPADFNRMMAEQQGACAICGRQNTELCIDHCHTTNKVRALLCHKCNMGIGQFNNSPRQMEKAIEYLKKHGNT